MFVKSISASFLMLLTNLAPVTALAASKDAYETKALSFLLKAFQDLLVAGKVFVSNFVALSEIATWFDRQFQDPGTYGQWMVISQLLIATLASAYCANYVVQLVLFPLRNRLQRKEFHVAYLRIGAAFMRFLIMLIPPVIFLGVAMVAITQTNAGSLAEDIVLMIVYSLALYQIVEAVVRFVLAPKTESLRFLPISTNNAKFLKRWSKWYAAVIIFGTCLSEVASILTMPVGAINAFKSLIALTVIIMTMIVIMKKKSVVAVFLRGQLSAADKDLTFFQSSRLWAARMWHILAIAYLVVGYFVTMLSAKNSFGIMQQGTIGTLLAIVLMRLFFFMVARSKGKKKLLPTASGLWRPIFHISAKCCIWIVGVAAVLASWGVDVSAILSSQLGQKIATSVFSLLSSLFVLLVIYEILHYMIERKLHRIDAEGNIVEADARMRTLLPMARNVLIFVLILIACMISLSAIGIDTGPLMAGAGILGVALGFGSQTLVKDFLTGMFILIEDTIAVGDVVDLTGHKGTVEGMSLRTVKLRDVHGALHVVPFSSISDIVNMSKDYAYAIIDMDVDYSSDLEKVQEVMMKVGADLCEDPEFKDRILEPIQLVGIQAFASSSITVRAKIKTKGGEQWDVRRAFFARIKPAFDIAGIEIPFPHVVYTQKGG